MKRLVVVVTALLAVALLPSCSSSSGICEAVKAGQDPITASGASYAAAGGPQKLEQAQKMREARRGDPVVVPGAEQRRGTPGERRRHPRWMTVARARTEDLTAS